MGANSFFFKNRLLFVRSSFQSDTNRKSAKVNPFVKMYLNLFCKYGRKENMEVYIYLLTSFSFSLPVELTGSWCHSDVWVGVGMGVGATL